MSILQTKTVKPKRKLDIEYYDASAWKYLYKTGSIKNEYKHNYDTDYLLEAFSMEKGELVEIYRSKAQESKEQIESILKEKFSIQKKVVNPDNVFIKKHYNERIQEIEGTVKGLRSKVFMFENKVDVLCGKKVKEFKRFDIESLKEMPIHEVLNIEPIFRGAGKSFYSAPWRDEKNASLVVYTESNSWYDFGESTGGDVIQLVMKLHDCDFISACKILK